MTAFVLHLSESQVLLAMDTLVMGGDTGTPLAFTTKFFPLPHLGGAMFVTGVADIAYQWFVRLQRFIARDIVHLDQYVKKSLCELGELVGLNEQLTATIYHVGWSVQESKYVCYAYRSTTGFESERLQYGTATKPPVPDASVSKFPEDFIRLVSEQRDADNDLPHEDRVHIGGEIQTLQLEDHGLVIKTVHRFDDYESTYDDMCSQLGS